MRRLLTSGAVLAIATLGVAAPAWAHAELDPGEVKANVPTRIEIVVEHGCGTQPISKVATQLPPELVDVQPEAPDGWTVSVADGVVTWDGSARPVKEDLRLGLTVTARAQAGAELGLPTVESCPDGASVRWIEDVPEGGDESQRPMPRLMVLEGAPAPTTTAAAPTTAAATTTATTAGAVTTATTATTAAPATTATTATTAASTTTIALATTSAGGDDDGESGTSGAAIAAVAAAVLAVAGGGIYLSRRAKRSAS